MSDGMRSDGVFLPQNRQVPNLLLGFGVVFAIPTAATLWRAATSEPAGFLSGLTAMALLMAGVLVVLPLLIARRLRAVRALLTDDFVAWTHDGRVTRSMRFADIAEVEVRPLGSVGFVHRNAEVRMTGQLAGAGIGSLVVGTAAVTDLGPLLRRLQVERARRPLHVVGAFTEDYLEGKQM